MGLSTPTLNDEHSNNYINKSLDLFIVHKPRSKPTLSE